MHDNYEDIKLYKKHVKDTKRNIAGDMVDVIGLDNMLYGVVWKMVCECIDDGVQKEDRKAIILEVVSKEIERWD